MIKSQKQFVFLVLMVANLQKAQAQVQLKWFGDGGIMKDVYKKEIPSFLFQIKETGNRGKVDSDTAVITLKRDSKGKILKYQFSVRGIYQESYDHKAGWEV
jgi:hypothetical protein